MFNDDEQLHVDPGDMDSGSDILSESVSFSDLRAPSQLYETSNTQLFQNFYLWHCMTLLLTLLAVFAIVLSPNYIPKNEGSKLFSYSTTCGLPLSDVPSYDGDKYTVTAPLHQMDTQVLILPGIWRDCNFLQKQLGAPECTTVGVDGVFGDHGIWTDDQLGGWLNLHSVGVHCSRFNVIVTKQLSQAIILIARHTCRNHTDLRVLDRMHWGQMLRQVHMINHQRIPLKRDDRIRANLKWGPFRVKARSPNLYFDVSNDDDP